MVGLRDHGKPAVSWWGSTVPVVGPTGTSTTWVGVRFRTTVAGRIAGFRFYDAFNATAVLSAQCQFWTWTPNRLPITSKPYLWRDGNSSAQWRQQWFRPWFRPIIGLDMIVVVLYSGGGFFRTNTQLGSPVTHNGIEFVSSFQSTALDLSIATITENTNANAVDVLFYPD